jgi:anion-transporting  ArsA/GET3 family ATPase
MAMEKLAQLRARIDADRPWDLVIVDTPPSRAALDFLDAPARIGSFLDGPLMRLLSAPARTTGRAGLRLIGAGTGLVAGVMDRILGAQLVGDAQVFVTSLDAVFGGFRERAERTYRMLQEDGTAFVVIAAPESDALREAAFFVERLREEDMPLASVVVNRVTRPAASWLTAERAAAAVEELDPHARGAVGTATETAAAALLRLHGERARRRDQEQRLIAAFLATYGELDCLQVPALPGDVHDLEGLRRIGALLGGDAAPALTRRGRPDDGRG